MRLWKNIKPNYKIGQKTINKKITIKSLDLEKHNPINKTRKESIEKEKSSESSINLSNKQNQSYDSSLEEEKSYIKNKNIKNKTTDSFSRNYKGIKSLLITSSRNGAKSRQNKLKRNIKTIYPIIRSNNNNKYRRNVLKFNFKKTFSQFQSNNTILNKWRDDFHKLFFKSLKKTKADFSSTIQRCSRNQNKLIFNHKKKFKKKLKINNKPLFDNKIKNSIMRENNKNENINNDDINNLSSDRKIYDTAKELHLNISIASSHRKTSNFQNSKKKYILSTDQFSSSSNSTRSVNKYEFSKTNNKFYKNYKRKRNFKEYMKESNILNIEWKKKIGLLDSEIKYNKNLLCDLNFQSNSIKDEMNLLIDSIHNYKMRLFGNSDLIIAFMNKDIFYQMNLNKTLEETCALLHLIPKIILKEYYAYTDRFISISEPGKENFITRIISNESECFNENMKLLFKIVNFVKSSFEVYIQLVNQVEEEMIIPQHDFEILRAIFQKCRYFTGNLTNLSKNLLKDYNFDKELIQKCKPILDHTKERLKNDRKSSDNKYRFDKYENDNNMNNKKNIKNKRNDNYFNNNKYRLKKSDTDNFSDKMNRNVNFKDNEFTQKLLRITQALETGGDSKNYKSNYAEELRLKQANFGKNGKFVGPMALIYSPLMTKMLKYIKKDIREKIISLRSSEKYIDSKDEY